MQKDIQISDPPLWERRHKKRLWSFMGFFFILLALGIALLINWLYSRGHISTDDAYVHGNIIPVSAQNEGRITDIYFDQGSYVQAGTILAQLDQTSALLEVESAKAALSDAVRKVVGFYLQAEEAEQTISLRQTQLNQMQKEAERRQALNCTHAIGEEAFAASQTQLKMAEINKDLALTAADLTKAQIIGMVPYDHPLIVNAKLQLQKAILNLKNTHIQAPTFGIIAQRVAQIGQIVRPGESLFTIVPMNQIWVEANFLETQLSDIMVGQPVILTSDMWGNNIVYHGEVIGTRPGTGVSFSLIPPQNATGNWIKIIQRVPVLISIDSNELQQHPLFIGLSMEARVDIRNQFTPSENPAKPLDHSTDIYAQQMQESEMMVTQILQDSFAPFSHFLQRYQQPNKTPCETH